MSSPNNSALTGEPCALSSFTFRLQNPSRYYSVAQTQDQFGNASTDHVSEGCKLTVDVLKAREEEADQDDIVVVSDLMCCFSQVISASQHQNLVCILLGDTSVSLAFDLPS